MTKLTWEFFWFLSSLAPIYWILLGGAVIGSAIGLLFQSPETGLKHKIGSFSRAFAIMYIICLAVGLIFMVNYSLSKKVYISKDRAQLGDVIKVRELIWVWKLNRPGWDLIEADTKVSASMQFHPVTENPKVRDLQYKVTLVSDGAEEDTLKWERSLTNSGFTPAGWLQYHLYDFNETNSKEAAKFSNPLRPEQQEEFKKLVVDFLAPRLVGTGKHVSEASFSFNQ